MFRSFPPCLLRFVDVSSLKYILKLMNFSKWLYIAKAGLIDHLYPVRLYKTYITKQQEFNSGFLVVNLLRPLVARLLTFPIIKEWC